MWKDDDIAGREWDRLSVFNLDEAAAFDQQMIEDQMRRAQSDRRRDHLRRGSREPPGR